MNTPQTTARTIPGDIQSLITDARALACARTPEQIRPLISESYRDTHDLGTLYAAAFGRLQVLAADLAAEYEHEFRRNA